MLCCQAVDLPSTELIVTSHEIIKRYKMTNEMEANFARKNLKYSSVLHWRI